MSEIIKPTCEEIFNELLEFVKQTIHSGWRHGVDREEVYFRKSDNTYWGVDYRVSTDGETHGLREGDADIYQVEPKEVKTVEYVLVKK